MSKWRKGPTTAASQCCFIETAAKPFRGSNYRVQPAEPGKIPPLFRRGSWWPFYSVLFTGFLLFFWWFTVPAGAAKTHLHQGGFPLEMETLLTALGDARKPANDAESRFPLTLVYPYLAYDIAADRLWQETRSAHIPQQPQRIIPQSIGITEILWAICPRERILAIHRSSRNPRYSFIAKTLPASLPSYGTGDAEMVIGYRPDLVLTTYYSDENFLHQLKRAQVPTVQLGFFGDLEQIVEQIRLIGRLIGEEPSAEQLVDIMAENLQAIRAHVADRQGDPPLRVLFYDHMGYVAGRHSTFDAICRMLGVINVAAEQGIDYFKQIDHETLLQWNPDRIIVPAESRLDRDLYQSRVLAGARAVQKHRIHGIPGVYLLSASQYLVASVNYLAGLLYD